MPKELDKQKMFKKILIKSLISLIIITTLVIVGSIYKEKISKLSIINPIAYVTTGILIIILYLSAFVFSIYFLKTNDPIFSDKTVYTIYSTHDLLSFLFNVLYGLFFILVFFITPTTVSGSSMNNTLYNGDRLLIWHLNYKVERGDIVIVDINKNYDDTENEEEFYIKRVVAVENDTVRYEAVTTTKGIIYVNDIKVEENVPYQRFKTSMSIHSTGESDLTSTYEGKIRSGYSLVLGDNRNHSRDSRYIGLIHNEDILGKAVFRYYSKTAGFGKIETSIL